MAARRLSKKMYENQKITKNLKNTKYELCNLNILHFFEIFDFSKVYIFVYISLYIYIYVYILYIYLFLELYIYIYIYIFNN